MTPKVVVVIDDDEGLLDLEAFVLSEQGYTVHRATDGRAGLALALRHRPAAIICDLRMGGLHGFEVLAAVRAEPTLKRTVVIVTSANADPADIARARALGAAHYLVKPFSLEELVALVDRHLATAAE